MIWKSIWSINSWKYWGHTTRKPDCFLTEMSKSITHTVNTTHSIYVKLSAHFVYILYFRFVRKNWKEKGYSFSVFWWQTIFEEFRDVIAHLNIDRAKISLKIQVNFFILPPPKSYFWIIFLEVTLIANNFSTYKILLDHIWLDYRPGKHFNCIFYVWHYTLNQCVRGLGVPKTI